MIEYRLLGPLEVARDGDAVPLGGLRRRATLAILLLNAGHVVPAERLSDDLYAGAAPATAVTQVQRQISELRRLLSEARIETTAPGYVLRVEPGQLDLHRFERLVEQGVDQLQRGDAATARTLLRDALDLWRGGALDDLSGEPFAQSAIARLEELRLAALERSVEAEIALGHAAGVVGRLEELVAVNPFRERLVELLMLSLYRSGRQADALAVYRHQRALLAEELGLEPGPTLKQLETAILRQDVGLTEATEPVEPATVVAVALDRRPSSALVDVATGNAFDTIVLELVSDEASVTTAALALDGLADSARTAAFVTGDWIADVSRFAGAYEAALVVVEAPPSFAEAPPAQLLQVSTADVALVFRGDAGVDGDAVYVPFGGGEHDWAALELAAAVAQTRGRGLRLVGTGGAPASRMLADASLAVQRALGVGSAPVLAPATADALLAVVENGALVIAGIGSRWRSDGLDPVRRALATEARAPAVLVHRGPHPGLLAPRESRTRFTWSLQN